MSYKPMDLKHHDRHQLRREPLARESIAYLFQLPDEQIAGYLYTWVNGESVAGSALFLYGPAVGDEPIEFLVNGVEMPLDQGFDDWQVGGLHVHHHADAERADLTFDGEDVHVEYHFEATSPAYLYSNHAEGSPQFIADDRHEQAGHISGVINFGGKEITFDGMGHRDHSWGTRHWGIAQHWKWFESQAGPELAVHFMELQMMGDRIFRGYVYRDETMAEITDLQISYEFDENFFHHHFDAVVHDELGRETTLSGDVFARYLMTPHPMSHNNEGSVALEIEGVPGVGHLEMQWQKPYIDYLREQEYMQRLATPARIPARTAG
jgi:hypothetical protein